VCDLAQGLNQYVMSEFDNGARLLGDGDELFGRHLSQGRMLPAQQGLGPNDPVVTQIEQRLVEDGEFPAPQGTVQLLFQCQPPGDVLVHAAGEIVVGIPPLFLGMVHGGIGIA